jgi:DNA-binding LacI/PurR family transcriptional regulator
VVGGNDLIALGVVHELSRLGMAVPDQVAVAGFDDFDFSGVTTPALTTVQVPGYAVGAQAARQLVLGTEMPRQVVLPVRLCVRESA